VFEESGWLLIACVTYVIEIVRNTANLIAASPWHFDNLRG